MCELAFRQLERQIVRLKLQTRRSDCYDENCETNSPRGLSMQGCA